MPLRELSAYLTMLPRLRAEESMRRVTEQQVASGALTTESADAIWQEWEQSARPDEAAGEGSFADPYWL